MKSKFRVTLPCAMTFAAAWLALAPRSQAEAPTGSEARHFDTVIAPILARHCLECHDASTREGKLDLSRKSAAMAGSKHGAVIVPGSAAKSRLWESVESDEMPEDRPALSAEEKKRLREWIDAGARWPGEEVDPMAHLRSADPSDLPTRRLTVDEYVRSVRSATGVNVEEEARRLLPPDGRADGFSNTAYHLRVDLPQVQAWATLAEMIASRMDARAFAEAHGGGLKDTGEASLRTFVDGAGRWLMRGPLDEREAATYLELARESVKGGGDRFVAARLVVEAMLQSPRFLYRVETQRGDGRPRPVTGPELASRLSYLVWGSPPDRDLARAGESGALKEAGAIERETDRLLGDPRAVEQSLRFARDWLDLDRLETLRPAPEKFPRWDAGLATEMREETLAYFREVVWERKLPMAALFNARFTHLTPRLAAHYGIEPATPGAASAVGPDAAFAPLSETPTRAADGLRLFYDFRQSDGRIVRERSGAGEGMDLEISDPGAVEWTESGLLVKSPVIIATSRPPKTLVAAIRDSRELTLEAWITPADTTQQGPARVLTLSDGTTRRNFTLGQDGGKFHTRLVTTKTDRNGAPYLESAPGIVSTRPTHVVAVRRASGEAVIHIDGEEAGRQRSEGDFSNWDEGFRFALANEISGDRPWRGELHLVAVYDRALADEEIRRHHAAGPRGEGSVRLSQPTPPRSEGKGELARYRFDRPAGDRVKNEVSGGADLDLKIEKADSVAWEAGGMVIRKSAKITTTGPARSLVDALKKSREFTVSAWITPATLDQKGPARIVTLSSGTGERNVTLGQEGDRYEIRVRAKGADRNGMPGWHSPPGSVKTERTHVLLSREASGRTRLFVDGQEAAARDLGGDLGEWSGDFRLSVGNETSGDRPWRGVFHEIAIFDRAISPDEAVSGGGWRRVDLTAVPGRGGLLTQGSLLTMGGDDASMVARGLFVLHDVLGSGVTNAPPGVDVSPIPPKPGQSRRAVAETRLAKADCKGCHAKFEPLAFGLEKFDGLGVWQEKDEHGNPLREDGQILFPGEAEPVAYRTVGELMDLLAESDRVRRTITRKLTQFAIGRPLGNADAAALDAIHARAEAGGGTYASLVKAIATSDLVRLTPTESQP